MPPTKTATLNLRIDPAIKEAAREAGFHEHRSLSNLVEFLIMRHCDELGISIPEQGTLFLEDNDE